MLIFLCQLVMWAYRCFFLFFFLSSTRSSFYYVFQFHLCKSNARPHKCNCRHQGTSLSFAVFFFIISNTMNIYVGSLSYGFNYFCQFNNLNIHMLLFLISPLEQVMFFFYYGCLLCRNQMLGNLTADIRSVH